MSLNPEPADPIERQQLYLPAKSYAQAAEAVFDQPDPRIDEDAIKESPPRAILVRNASEPRSLGEVIDESERASSPGSPALRHPKGRLENKSSHESYTSLAKENSPASNVTPKENKGGGESYASAVQEQLPTSDTLPNGDGNGMPVQPNLRNGINGDRTPESYEGAGVDEAPRSPTRRAHKRTSSRSMNGIASSPAPQPADRRNVGESNDKDLQTTTSGPPSQSQGGHGADGTDEKDLKPGQLIYENLRNKSGENLASIKASDGYELSMEQRENKPSDSESPAKADRKEGELVSGRRAGAGWSRSAIRWAPLNVPLQRRLQTLLVLLHTLSIVGGLALFFVLCAIPILWPILVPYLLYVLLSRASIDGKLSQRSQWLRRSKIWSLFGSYYPARLHRSQELEPTRKYIFGYHPHGIISHGAFAAFATEALGFSQLFPGITNTLLTLDSNFRIPLYREYALRMGLASVSRESCENILTKGGPNGEGMGRAITIVVGGARESLDALPYTLRLVLKRRKGFVKLAIRTGADLVPVLSFGENDLYDQFDASSHPYIHKAQMLVKKFMGFTVPLFHARGVFNYDVGMMPYRRPINIVVGKPIRIMQSKSPDPGYVDAIHDQYVQELLRIWEDWKDTFARHRHNELEIVE